MIPDSWTPHLRSEDGELLGYLSTEPDGIVPRSVFGAVLGEPGDRSAAETVLESCGLACLAEPWLLREEDGGESPVALIAAYPDRVLVSRTTYGFVDPMAETVVLDVPAGAERLRRPG